MVRAGEQLSSRYRLQEPVGHGGMGSVWRAADMVLGRDVAVKLLGGQAQEDPTSRARFRREALVLAQLTHPRLGNVYDYAEDPVVGAFIVMEYLHGETLEDRIARMGRLAPAEAAEIAAQVAEGLSAAHEAGIVHRDVKPANVILTAHGVKVVDFGIALADGDSRLTGAGNLIATAGYVAPECGRGLPGTPASDVYSLGVVLYQMLSGRRPFTGEDVAAVVGAHVHAPVPPLPPDIPPAIVACCMRALAKDPAQRPVPALRLMADLRDAVLAPLAAPGGNQGGTMVMRPVGEATAPTSAIPTTGTGGRGGPRRSTLVAMGAAVALLVAAGGVWTLTSRATAVKKPHAAASTAARSTPSPQVTHVVAAPKANAQWTVALAAQASQAPAVPAAFVTPGAATVLEENVQNGLTTKAGPVSVALTAPAGWSVSSVGSTSAAEIGGGAAWWTAWRVTPPASAAAGAYQIGVSTSCGTGCAAPAVTLQVIIAYSTFTATFDNDGMAPAAAAAGKDFDGVGESYQQEALDAVGYLPGAQVTYNGIPFSWPNTPVGEPDNTVALGQTFLLSGAGADIAFLGAAGYGPAGGDGIIYYTDGTQQPFRLVLDDWISPAATAGDDALAVTCAHWNSAPPGGAPQADHAVSVFYAAVPLQTGKTVEAVTLPTTAAPAVNTPSLHLFAVTIK